MWKRATTIAGAGIAWGAGVADLFSALPDHVDDSLSRFSLTVAVCCTGRLMLWCHNRPIAEAYEFGYGVGRRDQLRESNQRPLAPIRRVSRGLSEFNTVALKELNGHRKKVGV